MSRFLGLIAVLAILLGAMGFAAANAGHRTSLDLGLFTLYRVPVTFVAFSGLLVGMVVMFLVGIRTDLKVRSILRERLKEESQGERTWIDKNQQDLFADPGPDVEPRLPAAVEAPAVSRDEPELASVGGITPVSSVEPGPEADLPSTSGIETDPLSDVIPAPGEGKPIED